MIYKSLAVFLLLSFIPLSAQISVDSILTLKEVIIKIYPDDKSPFYSPSSIGIIDEKVLEKQQPQSLVAAFNTVAGVRMEERSPGSYRLSIRGSLLRSPFGVRNIKIYLDDFLLTDAGGNSYLNSLDPASVSRIELVKGPEGSIYGANTGGVVLVNPSHALPDSNKVVAGVARGSYGLIQQKLNFQRRIGKYHVDLYQGYQRSLGYRDHSGMERYFIQIRQRWHYAKKMQLKLFAMYSDLHYETPGGLTQIQFEEDPKQARPSAALPGAAEQKAGIYNKNLFLGAAHEMSISRRLKHVFSLFGNITDFRNPFITNYENRDEKSIGTRTWIKWTSSEHSALRWNWLSGLEWQRTDAEILNYGNRGGAMDTLQAADQLRSHQHFFFTRFTIHINNKLLLESALSINFFKYRYKNNFPTQTLTWRERKFTEQYMPKLALSYSVTDHLVARASVSRGFSPPTIAEVRPSDNLIYSNLQVESGWNYETGIRARTKNGKLWADAVAFWFVLDNTIVRRTNESGAEYFVNAGRTNQPGAELSWGAQIIKPGEGKLLKRIELKNSSSYYRFSFKNYEVAGNNFSGKQLTGVPGLVFVSSFTTYFKNFYVFVQHNYTDRIPLNDQNSTFAKAYHLVQAKCNYSIQVKKKYTSSLYVGSDNLLDQTYSLGNDINAVGGRYFNAAPRRNFYAGIEILF